MSLSYIPNHSFSPRSLKRSQCIKDLKHLLKCLGCGSGYTGHSFKRDGATYTLKLGIRDECIMLLGD